MTNKPSLRFPSFDDNWTEEKLSSLIKRHVDPVIVDVQKTYFQIGIRSHGKGIFHKEGITGKALGNKRVFWIKADALIVNIVFAWEHAIAITSAQESGMIASHRFPMFLPVENKASIAYLLHFFLTRKGRSLLELASPGGAGRNKTLGQREFENLKICVPKIQEQKKISDFLTSIEQHIDLLQKHYALLEQYKKECINKIYTRQLSFKDKSGNAYPDWEEKRINDICEKIRSGGTPRSSTKEFYDGNIPFLSISDMSKQGKYISSTKNSISEEGLKNSSSWIVPIGSIIYSMYASIGLVSINKIELATSQAVLNIVLKKDININFVFYFLTYIQDKIDKYVSVGTQGNLNAQTVKAFVIQVPASPEEQSKIGDFLSAVDNQIESVKQKIQKNIQFKKALLDQLFV